jgi:subtilisin family serine protease
MSWLISWSGVHSEEAVEKGHPKIESALSDLQQRYLLQRRDFYRSSARRQGLRIDDEDKIKVFILPGPGGDKGAIDLDTLRANGGEVIKSGRSVIKARVPITLLETIANRVQGVGFIKRPDRPYAGVVSEGVSLTGAALYQASGYNGQNVKVAVIDLGFAGLSTAITAGVLPPTVTRIDCTGSDCSPTDFPSEEEDHGTAVAEVVHDMAPAAALYLIKVDDSLDLLNAKDYCIANGIRIINHSVGWFNTNFYDGACWFDNTVCTADHAFKNGILWANSAGNHARMHYGATFVDSDGDRLHNVTPESNFISLYAFEGDPIVALLTWDAWPVTNQDYDLYLFNSSMELVASSTSVQDGTQPPDEEIYYVAPVSGTYSLAVKNSSATANLRFSIFTFYHDLHPFVAPTSLLSPADATGVMAVAAVNYTRWSTGPQESFSSQGPTTDGRMKPEISGPDGTSSFIYGSFFGTSAASPHVAGAAALILSNNPTFTVTQLWDALTSSAIDLGGGGQDPVFGFGKLNLSTLNVDPASVGFGDVIVGDSVEKVVTLQNIGTFNLTFGAVTVSGASFTLVADSCSGKSLALGGTCTLSTRFSPLLPGDFSGTLTVPSSDPVRRTILVPLAGNGKLVLNLSSPADLFSANACSMKNPPVFQWEANAVVAGYELQFSSDSAFESVPFKVRTSRTAHIMTSYQWKRVLSIPGANGGTVYWRVAGIESGGAVILSGNRSILIAPAQPVGVPAVSPVSRNDLPILTWQNRCNLKFKLWFGRDPGFSRKVSLSYRVPDPESNGGNFSRKLTSGQWSGIRRLVADLPSTPIYWYVESWDGLGRYTRTETMSFVLAD